MPVKDVGEIDRPSVDQCAEVGVVDEACSIALCLIDSPPIRRIVASRGQDLVAGGGGPTSNGVIIVLGD